MGRRHAGQNACTLVPLPLDPCTLVLLYPYPCTFVPAGHFDPMAFWIHKPFRSTGLSFQGSTDPWIQGPWIQNTNLSGARELVPGDACGPLSPVHSRQISGPGPPCPVTLGPTPHAWGARGSILGPFSLDSWKPKCPMNYCIDF